MLDFIVKNLCSTEDSNQHLNAPTGILLGATDQESASSSERLTCYMCVILSLGGGEGGEKKKDTVLTSFKNLLWLASTSRPANLK